MSTEVTPTPGDGPSPSSWDLSVGDEFIPHCRVERALGGGVDFEAYAVTDDRLLATVVLKMPRPHLVEDEVVLMGLAREAHYTETLRHPNIVRGYHSVTTGPRPYVALEWLPGECVDTLVDREGPLSLSRTLTVGTGLAAALHYMHLCDVVHLDVRPDNVILDRIPRLIDFNLAFTTDEASRIDVEVGTRGFLAPEQCAPPSTGVASPPSDVWGIGGTLFYCVTGISPFDYGDSDAAAPLRKRFPQLTGAPRALPNDTNEGLRQIIMACLRTDPRARPTPATVFSALTSLATDPDQSILDLSPPPAAPMPASEGRERFRAALAAKGTPVGSAKKRKGRR